MAATDAAVSTESERVRHSVNSGAAYLYSRHHSTSEATTSTTTSNAPKELGNDSDNRNPFRSHAKNGRLPYITCNRISRKVTLSKEYFSDRGQSRLAAWRCGMMRKMDPCIFPEFLRRDRKFSILVDGWRVHMTDILGYGGYGLVFKAKVEIGETKPLEAAVKFLFRMSKSGPALSNEFERACKVPQSIFAKGKMIQYLALCEKTTYNNAEAEVIIMELAEMGDLYDSLVKNGAPVIYCANHARRLTAMAIEALADLRRDGFMHRDLKAENLLFNHGGQMLLGDIGNLKDLAGKDPMQVQTVVGTEQHMAPEVRHHASQGSRQALYNCEKSDIWSLACIHFQLRTCLSVLGDGVLKTTLGDFSCADSLSNKCANDAFWIKVENWIKNIAPGGMYYARPDLNWTRQYQAEPFSDGERRFLNACLSLDHSTRPTFAELRDAVEGKRGVREDLRWLGRIGDSGTGDTTQAFDNAMKKRIAGFGEGKHTVTWPVDGGMNVEGEDDASSDFDFMSPEEYMKRLATQLKHTIQSVAEQLTYSTNVMEPKRTTRTANYIHIQFCVKTTAPIGRRRLRIVAEISKPTAKLTGTITFFRQKGEPSVYLQLIKCFERYHLQSNNI